MTTDAALPMPRTSASPLPRDGRVEHAWQWLVTQLAGRPLPQAIALVGMGDGDVLDALALHAPHTRVLALEPDAAQAHGFRAGSTWARWHGSGRLAYLVGPDYAGADEAWRVFAGTAGLPPVLLHPTLTLTPEAGHAAQVLKKILVGVAANREARRKFAPRYLVNSIRNLPAIVGGSDVRCLTDAYRGVPAVIAAAGPSLDAALPQLHDVHDRALFIACDTALRPCLAAGIAPQLAVGVDPSAFNARHMQSLPACPDTWLVAESALDRDATAPFDGRTFWFHVSDHEPWPWFRDLGLDIGQIDVWGSVLTAAFQLACLAGCDPIVIVGADLAFTDGRPYARGTTYEFDWALGTARGTSLEEVWHTQVAAHQLLEVPDLRGDATTATPALVSFRDWLVARAARSGHRVINASGAGILGGAGVEQGRLSDVLAAVAPVPRVATLARRHAGVSPSRMSRGLRALHPRLVDTQVATPLIARWMEFSGDGFDRTIVAAAVDDAARGLETKRGGGVPVPLVDWARLARVPAARTLPSRLPEAQARFRAAVAGGAVPSLDGTEEPVDDDRMRLLAEALRVLVGIQDEIRRHGDVRLEPWHAGSTGTLGYLWPERLRWAIATFEGLLGRAWGPAPEPAAAFFARAVSPRDASEDGDDGAMADVRHDSMQPLLELAGVWLRCRASLETHVDVRDVLMRLAGVASVARGSADRAAGAATLVVDLHTAEATISLHLPFAIAESALGRMRTGLIHAAAACDAPAALPRVETPELRVSIRRGDETLHHRDDSIAPSLTRLGRPRLLSAPDERWAIAHHLDDTVVCVRANDTRSTLVRVGGEMATHHGWPRPIVSELPLADGGAVAWATGRAMNPPTSPYVMYRRRRDDAPLIEDLPFTPTWGVWWNDRVYWGYLPSDSQPGRGVGSWAPGEGARIDHAGDIAMFGLFPDGADLLLDPATRRADFTFERRKLSRGWRWHPSRGLEARELGPHGAAGSRVVGHGWTTATFPEADLVTFEHDDGTHVAMTVYHPFRAAWLGDALLVCTVDNQLLLFDDMRGALAARQPNP